MAWGFCTYMDTSTAIYSRQTSLCFFPPVPGGKPKDVSWFDVAVGVSTHVQELYAGGDLGQSKSLQGPTAEDRAGEKTCCHLESGLFEHVKTFFSLVYWFLCSGAICLGMKPWSSILLY